MGKRPLEHLQVSRGHNAPHVQTQLIALYNLGQTSLRPSARNCRLLAKGKMKEATKKTQDLSSH